MATLDDIAQRLARLEEREMNDTVEKWKEIDAKISKLKGDLHPRLAAAAREQPRRNIAPAEHSPPL